MATKGAKLSGDAKMLISFFGLFYSPKKAMSRKSRRGFSLMISFHKGLVAWGGLWRSSQEGPRKLLTLLKSACTGKNNESRACLFKRPPAFPLMQSQEEPAISGSPRGHRAPGSPACGAGLATAYADGFFPKQQNPNWILQSWLEQFLSHVYLTHFK